MSCGHGRINSFYKALVAVLIVYLFELCQSIELPLLHHYLLLLLLLLLTSHTLHIITSSSSREEGT